MLPTQGNIVSMVLSILVGDQDTSILGAMDSEGYYMYYYCSHSKNQIVVLANNLVTVVA